MDEIGVGRPRRGRRQRLFHPNINVEDEVALQYYRLERVFSGPIEPKEGEAHYVKSPSAWTGFAALVAPAKVYLKLIGSSTFQSVPSPALAGIVTTIVSSVRRAVAAGSEYATQGARPGRKGMTHPAATAAMIPAAIMNLTCAMRRPLIGLTLLVLPATGS